jgi:hypothetical protein
VIASKDVISGKFISSMAFGVSFQVRIMIFIISEAILRISLDTSGVHDVNSL